jgi:hypothetical protein
LTSLKIVDSTKYIFFTSSLAPRSIDGDFIFLHLLR